MASHYYITASGSNTEKTAEVKRYTVWPLDSGPQNGIVNIKKTVESGNDPDDFAGSTRSSQTRYSGWGNT